MISYFKFLTLTFFTFLIGCKNEPDKKKSMDSNNKLACNPYFVYDNVVHYYFDIGEDEVWKIEDKKNKSNKEIRQLELLVQRTPDNLSDTSILANIEDIGFVKKSLPANKLDMLGQFFCERKHEEIYSMSCIAIYRDILVFKKQNRVVGVAKICFECDQHVISGTKINTDEFGQSGDYKRLYKLLH